MEGSLHIVSVSWVVCPFQSESRHMLFTFFFCLFIQTTVVNLVVLQPYLFFPSQNSDCLLSVVPNNMTSSIPHLCINPPSASMNLGYSDLFYDSLLVWGNRYSLLLHKCSVFVCFVCPCSCGHSCLFCFCCLFIYRRRRIAPGASTVGARLEWEIRVKSSTQVEPAWQMIAAILI